MIRHLINFISDRVSSYHATDSAGEVSPSPASPAPSFPPTIEPPSIDAATKIAMTRFRAQVEKEV